MRQQRGLKENAFERQLYLIRKQASHQLRDDAAMDQSQMFYICSLSTRVMIYKGMLRTLQLMDYYPDLSAGDYTTHLAMVHSRFSTNTFPSWDRAQPGRFMAHNGEINTLRGNINWMRAREGVMQSALFGDELASVFPVIEPDCSDSGNFDNVLEFLLMSGRSLQEAIMMMVPEPLAEACHDGGHQKGVLRVPFVVDGSLGRAGIHHVHRRTLHWRIARPKWPEAESLLRDTR
ncbi:MAG: hypothetical protein CM1200mP20_02870 [Pseudomonadota bacterium]|nr:MAG: hypothetical protein CM1200mP20_02870 [Pseudomonadota bacterium]